ncbi:MAG: beta-ketoacyl-ACP synthase III, partial [Methyloceanibacter sp.]
MSTVRSVIRGVGGYLPARVVTNEELAGLVDTSDEWITARTGIRERHIVADDELTSTMGVIAAKAALADAGLTSDDIDLIILATSTPDQTFPATAVTIQAELGITHGAAFDVQAVCSGFVFALATADNYLKGGTFKRALVIGSEAFSRILDWEDRNTCVLFGDGAGAVIVEAQDLDGTMDDRGILATCLRSDGRYRDKLYVDGGPSSTGTVGHVRMDGPEVFRHAVTKISEVVGDTLKQSGFQSSDIDWFVPHQANRRILNGAARKLGLDPERIVITVDKHANTSAASIPLALDTACTDGR